MNKIYAYLDKLSNEFIRLRTEDSDYSEFPDHNFDWEYSVYGEVRELLPNDTLAPLVKNVRITHYADSNISHKQITGRSFMVIFVWSTNPQWVGIPIIRVMWRRSPMVLIFFCP